MSKQLPPDPSLEQLKKQAKDLHKAHQRAESEALRRITEHHPRRAGAAEAEIRQAAFSLQDAQLVIAREYGFESWPRLVQAISASEVSPGAGAVAPLAAYPSDLSEGDLVPARVADIRPVPQSLLEDSEQQIESFMVCLAADDKVLPITIGRSEGQALAGALRDVQLARPLSYNLLQNMLAAFGGQVRRLVIHTLEADVFYAHIQVEKEEETFAFDCRPSDGMVVATLSAAPIFLSREVLQQAAKDIDLSELERVGFENTTAADAGQVRVQMRRRGSSAAP